MVLVPAGTLWRVVYPSAVWALMAWGLPLLKARWPLMRIWTRASLVGTAMSPVVPAGAVGARAYPGPGGGGPQPVGRGRGGGGSASQGPLAGTGGGASRPGSSP